MQDRNIVIIFDNGTVQMEANGFKGQACEEKMKAFIDALGMEQSSIKKPEYYQEDQTHLYN